MIAHLSYLSSWFGSYDCTSILLKFLIWHHMIDSNTAVQVSAGKDFLVPLNYFLLLNIIESRITNLLIAVFLMSYLALLYWPIHMSKCGRIMTYLVIFRDGSYMSVSCNLLGDFLCTLSTKLLHHWA